MNSATTGQGQINANGASQAAFGAYGELASVTGMREGQPQLTPRLDEARKILDAIQRSK